MMHRFLIVFCSLSLLLGCGDSTTNPPGETDTGVVADTASSADTAASDTAAPGPCAGKVDGASCDDGDPCTLNDTCSGGVCVGGTNDPCESENVCEVGTCIAGEGCKYEPVSDGTTCSVNCFNAAMCVAGKCQVDLESALQCPEPNENQPCLTDIQCDQTTGQCTVEVFAQPGTACDADSDLCTEEACNEAGSCEATGDVNECTTEKEDEPCHLWACSKKTGECSSGGLVGAVTCDDGNGCTENDTCGLDDFGYPSCVGTPIPIDDANPCTSDTCVDGTIAHDPIDGKSCDLDDPCSPVGLCNQGSCEPTKTCECTLDTDCEQPANKCLGEAFCDTSGAKPVCAIKPESIVKCDAIDAACEINACVPETGQCVVQPVADGLVCNDGNACTLKDACLNGVCSGGETLVCDDGLFCNGEESCDAKLGCQPGDAPSLSDGVDCTADSCDEANDAIIHTPNPKACDNGLFCDGKEVCDPNTGCGPGEAPKVDDGVDCTTDSCDEATDTITHEPNPKSCDNGLFCDGIEVCDAEKGCQPGTKPDLSDGIDCTVDSCDEAADSVVHAPNDKACDNGLFCDGAETCALGKGCVAGDAPTIDDGVDCTTDTCDEANDTVTHKPSNLICDNGLFCDGEELCDPVAGCQAGKAPVVDDDVDCTQDSCNEALNKVVHEPLDAVCDNGLFCDGKETCDAVKGCVTSDAPPTDDGIACTQDACDESLDKVTHTPQDALCDNGKACDGKETCDLGKGCVSSGELAVDDGIACTVDSCNDETGEVTHIPTDSLCDNGLFCDGKETCDPKKGCVPGTPPTEEDGIACTVASCDEAADTLVHTPTDSLCDNGLYCDGQETCDAQKDCLPGTPPVVDDGVDCTQDSCDETADKVVNKPNDLVCGDLEVANCFMATCDIQLGCQETPIPACCGNAIKEVGEECDDGNDVLLDGCDLDCVDECKYFTEGTVKSHTKLSGSQIGYLQLELDNGDLFGYSLAAIGDVNGDGNDDIAIGAPHDDDGGFNVGAIYIGLLNEKAEFISFTKISGKSMTEPPTEGAKFGYSLASLGDVDGDGVPDLAVGAPFDNSGGSEAGAVWVLLIDKTGGLASNQRIVGESAGHRLGAAVVGMGDLNEDGVQDFIASEPGAATCDQVLRVINLKPNGSVSSNKLLEVSDVPDDCKAGFGYALTNVGEVAPDNYPDLLVGSEIANGQDEGQTVYYINVTGPTVGKLSTEMKGSSTHDFGASVASLGDVDSDGTVDVAIGVPASDEGASNAGAIQIQPLVWSGPASKFLSKIADGQANFQGKLDEGDRFGRAVIRLNSGGHPILAVGAPFDDDTGKDRGAVWITRLESSCSICGNGVVEPLEDCEGGQNCGVNCKELVWMLDVNHEATVMTSKHYIAHFKNEVTYLTASEKCKSWGGWVVHPTSQEIFDAMQQTSVVDGLVWGWVGIEISDTGAHYIGGLNQTIWAGQAVLAEDLMGCPGAGAIKLCEITGPRKVYYRQYMEQKCADFCFGGSYRDSWNQGGNNPSTFPYWCQIPID